MEGDETNVFVDFGKLLGGIASSQGVFRFWRTYDSPSSVKPQSLLTVLLKRNGA
jgi:hypothetical protein